MTDRNRDKWPWWRRLIVRVAWAVDIEDGSGTGAPSQSKVLAYLFFLCLCFAEEVTWTFVGGMAVVLAASYGRSMFRHALNTAQSIFGKKESGGPDA